MKLYKKRLRNMAELELEKRRLQKERDLLEEEGILSFDEVIGAVASSGALGGKIPLILNVVSRVAPFAGTFAGPIINIARGWLASRAEKHENETHVAGDEQAKQNGQSKVKTTLLSLGKEVVGSYLKWKAMELSYKGIKHIVKKQNAQKARKAANLEK